MRYRVSPFLTVYVVRSSAAAFGAVVPLILRSLTGAEFWVELQALSKPTSDIKNICRVVFILITFNYSLAVLMRWKLSYGTWTERHKMAILQRRTFPFKFADAFYQL